MNNKPGYLKQTVGLYWSFFKRYRISLFLIIFSFIISSASSTIVPLYLKKFVDLLAYKASEPDVLNQIYHIFLVIIILRFIQFVFKRVVMFFDSYLCSKTMADLYHFSFEYLHKHSFNFFNNNFVGSLVKRLNRFVRSFESINDRVIFNVCEMIIEIGIILGVLFYRNFYLGIALLVWIVVYMTISILFTRYRLKFDILRSAADSAVSGVLADTITNHVNVKLFNGYGKENIGFRETVGKYSKLQLKTWYLDGMFDGFQTFLVMILEVMLMWIGIILWTKGMFTPGDFMMVQAYVITVILNIWGFGRVISHVYSDLSEAAEMTEILVTPHEITDILGAKDLVVTKGKIEYINVGFNYRETRKILNKFNLEIQSGDKIALVGPSGAGKSTVFKILLRMHDVSGGKILIDGQNIAKVTQESLWKNISLVPQDPILFHRSLRENIRYGRFDATDQEVETAAKLAHCHEFIDNLESGYETFVGERGVKLSGGERQRVAIARAILKNAPILLLDEATSSLDSESEHYIQDALNNLMKGKTVIMIAHRLSTIMSADRILVIDHGVVVEDGNHSQLLKKKVGLYKKLWDLQAGGFIK
ncbi:MAG: ABC transporter ATP-binding protein [Candidatus Magasanikbacteria bacterium]